LSGIPPHSTSGAGRDDKSAEGDVTEPNNQGLHTYPDCPLKLSIE
jgi:hypothetical protein